MGSSMYGAHKEGRNITVKNELNCLANSELSLDI